METCIRRLGAGLATLVLAGAAGMASAGPRSDVPLGLFGKPIVGNVNFVGTQASMRTLPNNGKGSNPACAITQNELSATLSGVPDGAKIESAHLYWAGSGSTPDYQVIFNDKTINAEDNRQYTTRSNENAYFSGAANVTQYVSGNGTYRFRGLSINTSNSYCAVEGVLGGFALLVVYSHKNEPVRQMNLYEGFQHIRNDGDDKNTTVTVNLGGFRIPDLSRTNATGRLGHITWEGDPTLSEGGEVLRFNNYEMYDSNNPSGNQFNSRSTIGGAATSHGIDFDVYTLASPVIKTGQTSATTTYRTGQDLVLLSSEIIAVPHLVDEPVDLRIDKVRTTQLGWFRNVSYTLTVSNLGPGTDHGPITVRDTLPAGLISGAGSGSGWTCTRGSTVECVHPGPLAKGQSLPPITVTAFVLLNLGILNTATVTSEANDTNPANNVDTDAGQTEDSGSGVSYVFTDSRCVQKIAIGASNQTCKLFAGPVEAGESRPIFVTAISDGTPINQPDTNLQFGLSCQNPAAGQLGASYGVSLPVCEPNNQTPSTAKWSAATSAKFGNTPSASLNFQYNDVGKLRLHVYSPATKKSSSSTAFVVKPARLAFSVIKRTSDNVANPEAKTGAGEIFVRAGEAFTVSVFGATRQGAVTPSFGAEGAQVELEFDRAEAASEAAAMGTMPLLAGEFNSLQGGVFSGAGWSWSEVGILRLTPRLVGNNYLGAGDVAAETRHVGRFVPAYFKTEAFGHFECLPKMQCHAAGNGAVYSTQPFFATVVPMALDGQALDNFVGPFARDITVSAFNGPGGSGANPGGGSLKLGAQSPVKVTAASIKAGEPIRIQLNYSLPKAYSHLQPNVLDWTAPTPVFLRAIATGDPISSLRNPATSSAEGGLTVINGRLQLSNGAGSELLKLPITTKAQFWTGSAWENNTNDDDSVVSYGAANLSFLRCGGSLAAGAGCKSVLGPLPGNPYKLVAGSGGFAIKAPGAGNTGSASLIVNNPAWLPSTQTRLVFGAFHNSRLIYLREMY